MIIPIFKTASMGAALLMLVALPLYYLFRFRKDKNVMRNAIAGFLIYMLTSVILNVLVSLIFDPQQAKDPLISGLTFAVFNGGSFLVGAIAVLTFAHKRGEKMNPAHLALGFMVMFIAATVPLLLNYFMFSFAINAGSLETAVAGITPEQAAAITNQMVTASPIYFLNFFAARLFEFAVYGFAAMHILEGIEKNALLQSVGIAFASIFALYVLPSLIIKLFGGMISSVLISDLLVLISQGAVASYCFAKLKPWLSNS